ncbi:MAG TPA: GSCFA domain-containing protein [Puia sp.]|nr:GSCFA domain-containing protein [Puia sp.]
MQFMLDITIPSPPEKINYRHPVLLVGSCFTEHIGKNLAALKLNTLQNPNGILFDPASVASTLVSYVQHKHYHKDDLFCMDELWQSWQHHGSFANPDPDECLQKINESQDRAHAFLQKAGWLIITLGTSFSYRLAETCPAAMRNGAGSVAAEVANCHRAPAQWFRKHLMGIEETNAMLDNCIHQLFQFNPGIRIVFTVSPVRHIRDGIIENNRSKARLIEVVQQLCNKFDRIHYFPAYELVIDVLRDYRFYDIDLVHPNYQATEYVLEQFEKHFIDEPSQAMMKELAKIIIARKHKAFQPGTRAHRHFLQTQAQRTRELLIKYPFLDLQEELSYFANGME